MPAVADIEVVADDAELFGLHAAEGAGGFDIEREGVDADNGFVVAGDVDFSVVGSDVAWAARAHVNLFDALSGDGVDDLDGVGGMDSGVEIGAIVDEVLTEIAEAAAVVAGEPVGDDVGVGAVDEADFSVVAAPGAFVEEVGRVGFGRGGRGGLGVFFAAGE